MSVLAFVRRSFVDRAAVNVTIPGGLSDSASSCVVSDASTFPSANFIVTVDQGLATEETILVDSVSGNTLTFDIAGRGYGNPGTAQAHAANCSILHTFNAQDPDEANYTASQTVGLIEVEGDLIIGDSANTFARLARGAAHSTLQVVGSTLAWVGFGSGRSQSIATTSHGNTDGTDTTYARSDHIHAIDLAAVESVMTAKGDLVLGTGAATGAIESVGANGTGLVADSTQTNGVRWDNPVLAFDSNHLASPYTCTGTLTAFLTTASLGVGTWVVTFNGAVATATAGLTAIKAVVGTATATFEGCYSGEVNVATGTIERLGLSFEVVVTVAGTISFEAILHGGAATVEATTTTDGFTNATGYTAIRVK